MRSASRALLPGCAFVLASFAAAPPVALAEDWPIVGARARAMGGAGVANDVSPFWNPAALALVPKKDEKEKEKPSRLSLQAYGLSIEATWEMAAVGDIIRDIDNIADFFFTNDFEAIQGRLNAGTATAADIRTAIGLVKQIQDLDKEGEGLYAYTGGEGAVMVSMPWFSFGIFYRGFGIAGVDPVVDWSFLSNSAFADGGFAEMFNTTGTTNSPATSDGTTFSSELQAQAGLTPAQANEMAFQAEQAGVPLNDPAFRASLVAIAQATVAAGAGGATELDTLYWNQSGFLLRGITVKEAGISIARYHEFFGLHASLGVNLKYIEAITFQNLIALARLQDGEMTLDKILDDFNRKRDVSGTFGVDAGLLLRPLPGLSVGVTGRNLNRPVFAWEGPRSYYLPRQFRAGASFNLGAITIAADGDLYPVPSRVLEDYKTQIIGGGIELNPAAKDEIGAALRLGAYQNVAIKTEELVYTAGIAIWFGPLRIEAAAASTKATYDVENPDQEFDSSPSEGWFEDEYPERWGLSATVSLKFGF